MAKFPVVLICDDDSNFHLAVKQSLKGRFELRSAYNTDEAMAILRNQPLDAILLDIHMRTEDEGLKAIPRLHELDAELPIVMSSGSTDFKTVREAMRLGAVDYVAKDFDPNDLQHVLERVLERKTLIQRRDQQNFEAVAQQKQHVFLGNSPRIQTLRKAIEKIRNSPANVVITGETGTGKEVVARQLRRTLSDGSLAPFVAIDSSTIQSTMAESILFGHEKGAFTGADKSMKGIFEEANGGIVYFDEIANMPLDIQAKLLRVIQEKEICRIGSSRVIPLEFRVVCATNRNLDDMVAKGQFKDDLLQRLNVLPIDLPPLRERTEDIPVLVEHFLRKQTGGNPVRFSEETLDVLKNHSWPGNIRELSNVVAYVVTMAEGDEIEPADLPPKLRDAARRGQPRAEALSTATGPAEGFYVQVSRFEKDLLAREYQRFEKNVSRMALALDMDRSHLHSKLREYGIHVNKRGGDKENG